MTRRTAEVSLTADLADLLIAEVARAERRARDAHDAGTCGESEWSCSHCESEATR